ncbi:MAG: hypothetical protein C7B44_05675 [Sulfobacillus thermosulfidooxidans]|nr:MAG: hypothetical protein C7B44_05675 [Sulfobacillus thermosulfidooxidans]
MATLFDTLVARPDLAEATTFLVLGVQSDSLTAHSLVRWQQPEDFFTLGYTLGALLRQELGPQNALDVLAAFSTAALRALTDAAPSPDA